MRHLFTYFSAAMGVLLAATPVCAQTVTYRISKPAAQLLSQSQMDSLSLRVRTMGVLGTGSLVPARAIADSAARVECPMPVMHPDSTYKGAALNAPRTPVTPNGGYGMPTAVPTCTNPYNSRR